MKKGATHSRLGVIGSADFKALLLHPLPRKRRLRFLESSSSSSSSRRPKLKRRVSYDPVQQDCWMDDAPVRARFSKGLCKNCHQRREREREKERKSIMVGSLLASSCREGKKRDKADEGGREKKRKSGEMLSCEARGEGEGMEDANGIASRISRQLVAGTRKHSN